MHSAYTSKQTKLAQEQVLSSEDGTSEQGKAGHDRWLFKTIPWIYT